MVVVGVGGFGDLVEEGWGERPAGVGDRTGLPNVIDVDGELSVDACDSDRDLAGGGKAMCA